MCAPLPAQWSINIYLDHNRCLVHYGPGRIIRVILRETNINNITINNKKITNKILYKANIELSCHPDGYMQ